MDACFRMCSLQFTCASRAFQLLLTLVVCKSSCKIKHTGNMNLSWGSLDNADRSVLSEGLSIENRQFPIENRNPPYRNMSIFLVAEIVFSKSPTTENIRWLW